MEQQQQFGRESGVSLLQAVVFLAVVILVGAGIYEATQSSKESLDKAKRTGEAGAMTDMAIERLRLLLTDTGPNKQAGICRLFNTPMRSVGTGNIYLRLPATGNEDPLAPDWTKAFPANLWVQNATLTNCKQDAFTRCLSPLPNMPGIADSFVARKPVVIASMIPVNMRNTSGRAVDPVTTSASSPTSVNARDIGFVVSAKVLVPENGQTNVAGLGYATIWTGQLTCGFTATSGQIFYLNPSAIGSGMVSDPTAPSGSGTIFSQMEMPALVDQVLDVSFLQYENTLWSTAGTIFKSDYSGSTVSSACREQHYRCPKATTARQWQPNALAAEAIVKYVPNSLINSQSVVAAPEIFFSNTSGGSTVHGAATYQLSAQDIPPMTPAPAPYKPGYVTILQSPAEIDAHFTDGQSMCSQICVPPSYNTGGDPFRATFSGAPRSEYAVLGSVLGPFVDPNSATYCSCCADKQCGRTGLKSSTACVNQGPEPLDSRISECEGADTNSVYHHTVFDDLDSSTFTANSCVAVRADGSGNLAFSSNDCTSSLPPLCYFQGQIAVGLSLDTKAPVPVAFSGARQGCYKLGDERVDVGELGKRMNMQNTTAELAFLAGTQQGTNYRFVNASTAGQFVSPETDSQLNSAQATLKANSVSDKAWVGLRTDASSRFFSPPPELESGFLSSVGYYVKPSKELVIYSDPAPFTTGTNLLLAHTRKFFGPIATGSPVNGSHVICRSLSATTSSDGTMANRIFLTNATVNDVAGAAAACANEGGVFLPPLRGTEWHYALNLVAPPAADYPWPDVGGLTNTAWIGYQKSSSAIAGYRLAAAPASGTTKVIWDGTASTSASPKWRLCTARNGSKPSFKLIDATPSPSPSCSGSFPTPFGPIRDDALVDTHDLLLYLAVQHNKGNIGDTDAVDLNNAP
jgi:hypothetical protein